MMDPYSIRTYSGFGRSQAAAGYQIEASSAAEIEAAYHLATTEGKRIAVRGAGRSYGDPNFAAEQMVLDLTPFKKVHSFDSESKVIDVEGGATLEDIWRFCLPKGAWLPVVSGTTRPTIGGALAMNIHGKNAFLKGTIGEHVLDMDVVAPSGTMRLTPEDPLFSVVVSGAGLLGVISRVRLQMKPVSSGMVRVEAAHFSNWADHFAAFERFEGDAEYVVSWVDGFSNGRGIIHAGWHEDGALASLLEASQDLPGRVFGVIPKGQVWRILKLLNNPVGIRSINAVKSISGKLIEHGKVKSQTLAAFNFLLDYVPDWERAYLPGGLIQCQYFVPKESASDVFPALLSRCRAEGLAPYLVVTKRHRPDKLPFVFQHAVDGYSIAMDFKVTDNNRSRLWKLAHTMGHEVLSVGGRFYLAKDSTLTAELFQQSIGDAAMERYRSAKAALDPSGILMSAQAQRLGLV